MEKTGLTLQEKIKYLKNIHSRNNKFAITLNIIEKKSTLFPKHKFNNLRHLLQDTYLLLQAMSNIRKKSGALTPGPIQDLSTVDGILLETIYSISQVLKKNPISPY